MMRDSTTLLHRVQEWNIPGISSTGDTLLKIAVTILVAVLVYVIARKWIGKWIKFLVGKTKSNWDDILYEQRFFNKLAYLIPPIAAYVILTFIDWEHKYILRRMVDIWLVVASLFIITALLNAINKIYESYPISKNRPITFFIQLIKVFLYTVTIITVISIFVNKSPEHLIECFCGGVVADFQGFHSRIRGGYPIDGKRYGEDRRLDRDA